MALVLFMVLGAAAPAPIQRNQWTTNFPGQSIKGATLFAATMTVGQVSISADLANPQIGFNAGTVGDLGWDTGGVFLKAGNTTITGWYTQTGTGHTNISSSIDRAPVTLLGSTNALFFPTNAAAGNVMTSDAVGNGRWVAPVAGGVTSVGLSVPSNLGGTNSGNVTSTGQLGFTNTFQTANTVFAGPTSGSKAEPTFRALVAADIPTPTVTTLTPATSVAIDFTGTVYQYLIVTNDTTFTGSNLGAGRAIALKLFAGSTNYNLTFPAWAFIGNTAPATISSNKTAVLSVTAFDANTTNVVAAYAVQP